MRPSQDLLHALARDHRRFDDRCRALLDTRRTERTLQALTVDLLAHEAAEQVVLHPLATTRLDNGPALVTDRIEEEDLLERLLSAAVDAGDLTSESFETAFTNVHRHLIEHFDREELEVFPLIRHVAERRELRALGRTYEALIVRIPTRLKDEDGTTIDLTRTERRPLLRARDAALQIMADLDHTPPAGVHVGDDLYAPGRIPATVEEDHVDR